MYEHYGFYTKEGSRCMDEEFLSLPYLLSEDTAFDMNIMKDYDGELVLGATPFSEKAGVYNYVHGYVGVEELEGNRGRKRMKR